IAEPSWLGCLGTMLCKTAAINRASYIPFQVGRYLASLVRFEKYVSVFLTKSDDPPNVPASNLFLYLR
ncbi:MAG: hypothetical protein ACF8OB_11200, partial [Phycisphaeraceae bacterium JB051]